MVEQLVILCSDQILPTDLPASLLEASGGGLLQLSFKEAKQQVIHDFEYNYIISALQRNKGNITKTAEEMWVYRQNLQQKMKEYNIRWEPNLEEWDKHLSYQKHRFLF